jgi:hypothetical protein
VLFKSKLLYTLIEYTNKKIETFSKKTNDMLLHSKDSQQSLSEDQRKGKMRIEKYEKLYRHIMKKFDKIIEEGIVYSLYVISKLEQISGDWSQLNEGEIMNFEDIFENDKGIFIQQYKQLKGEGGSMIEAEKGSKIEEQKGSKIEEQKGSKVEEQKGSKVEEQKGSKVEDYKKN